MAQFNARENNSNIEPWMDIIADDAVMVLPGLQHLEGKQGNHDGDHPALDIGIFMHIHCTHIQYDETLNI